MISESLSALKQAKEDIYNQLIEKGAELEEGAGFSSFSLAVQEMSTGIDVVCGEALPVEIKDGRVFVIPQTTVKSIYTMIDEPVSPIEGDIWVVIGEQTKEPFNYKNNKSPFLFLGLYSAKQYVNGNWIEVSAYIGKNNVWNNFSDNILNAISFNGNYSSYNVAYNNKLYKIYEIPGSGTLTFSKQISNVDIWICSSGAQSSSGYFSASGGSGGKSKSIYNQTLSGDYIITIGAAVRGSSSTSATSFGSLLVTEDGFINNSNNKMGTGGGGSFVGLYYSNMNYGDGISKIPFEDSKNFYPLCAGGGGGAFYNSSGSTPRFQGGDGGENGSDGKAGTSVSGSFPINGGKGAYGGGDGGKCTGATTFIDPTDAFTYGSGCGGRSGYYISSSESNYFSSLANNYQGVCFVRIPLS